MKNVFYKIFIIFVILIIIVNLLSIFNISLFGFRIFRIGSGSMEPYLKKNDIILVSHKKQYKVNDVITFKNQYNEIITHRIIKMNNKEIITKGDANNVEDDKILLKNVIGRVIFKVTGLGFVLYLFNNILTWILLFVLGLVITIFIPDKKKNI